MKFPLRGLVKQPLQYCGEPYDSQVATSVFFLGAGCGVSPPGHHSRSSIAGIALEATAPLPCAGSTPHQSAAPSTGTAPASASPRRQPSPAPYVWAKNPESSGVREGDSVPPAFPPVFIRPATAPPYVPPSSTAVVQNAPSQAPTRAAETANAASVVSARLPKSPSSNTTPLKIIPSTGTNARRARGESDRGT